jgi:hypothetical protein
MFRELEVNHGAKPVLLETSHQQGVCGSPNPQQRVFILRLLGSGLATG